jgi:hypothetical protein
MFNAAAEPNAAAEQPPSLTASFRKDRMFLQFQRSRRTDETQVSVIAASANCGQVTRFRRIIDSLVGDGT